MWNARQSPMDALIIRTTKQFQLLNIGIIWTYYLFPDLLIAVH